MSLTNGQPESGVISHSPEKWGDMANRYRNIVAAIENLLTQLRQNARRDEFYLRLEAARDVYRHEMAWHRYEALCCRCRTMVDLGLIKLNDER